MATQTTKEVNLEASPSQTRFLTSNNAFTLYNGGVGSGKTHAGALWSMLMALTYSDCKGLITANSYSQLKKATIQTFMKVLNEAGINYKYKSQDGIIDVFVGSKKVEIYCISMEKFDLLRGIEVGWVWSDECAFYREEAFDVLIGRIRDKRGPCIWKGTTTPQGYNWLWRRFVEKPLPDSCVIQGSTLENLHNLGPTYYETLKSNYDSKLARQEIEGEFINLSSGKVYHSFDRKVNVQNFMRPPHTQILLGIDFNVNPLCAVFGYILDDEIFIFDELYLKDSNTFQAAKEAAKRYQEHIDVIPDATGNKRHSNSTKTDHEILRRTPGMTVLKVSNPPIKDRVNNLNRLFEQRRIWIHPNCEKTILDLEQLVHDNRDPMLSHISDALGYLAWNKFPLQKIRREASVSYG